MTNTLQIRLATIEDASALANTGTRLFLQAYDGLIPTNEMTAHLAEGFNTAQQRLELANPAVVSILVESGSDIAGFAQLRRKPIPVADAADAEIELWRIYVDQEWHGKGIAQQLIGKAGEMARSFSAHGVWLAVWEQNLRAISFYRKIGFEAVGCQAFQVNTVIQNDVVMRAPADAF